MSQSNSLDIAADNLKTSAGSDVKEQPEKTKLQIKLGMFFLKNILAEKKANESLAS